MQPIFTCWFTEIKLRDVHQKLMNKRVVLWFEFLSKRFGPGPSSVELQVRWKRCKVCIRQERGNKHSKKHSSARGSLRDLEETEVGV